MRIVSITSLVQLLMFQLHLVIGSEGKNYTVDFYSRNVELKEIDSVRNLFQLDDGNLAIISKNSNLVINSYSGEKVREIPEKEFSFANCKENFCMYMNYNQVDKKDIIHIYDMTDGNIIYTISDQLSEAMYLGEDKLYLVKSSGAKQIVDIKSKAVKAELEIRLSSPFLSNGFVFFLDFTNRQLSKLDLADKKVTNADSKEYTRLGDMDSNYLFTTDKDNLYIWKKSDLTVTKTISDFSPADIDYLNSDIFYVKMKNTASYGFDLKFFNSKEEKLTEPITEFSNADLFKLNYDSFAFVQNNLVVIELSSSGLGILWLTMGIIALMFLIVSFLVLWKIKCNQVDITKDEQLLAASLSKQNA